MAASVLTQPNYGILYPPADNASTITNVITKNIAAFKDANSNVYDLTVGASSNIIAQAVEGISLEHGAHQAVTLSAASGSNSVDYLKVSRSNNRVLLSDEQEGGLTIKTKDTFIGSAHFVESPSSLTLSMPSLNEGLIVAPPVAMRSTLAVAYDTALNQNLFVTGDALLGGRITSYDSMFAPEMAVFKNGSNAGEQTGYSWKINAKDQLELVKYSFYGDSNSPVAKKVAVFGTGSFGSNATSDVIYSASFIDAFSLDNVGGASGGSVGPFPGDGGAGGGGGSGNFTVVPSGQYSLLSMAIGSSNVNSNVALSVQGDIACTSTVSSVAFNTTSDRRLKDVLESIDGRSALEGIMALTPTTYAWKTDESHAARAGFLAQDVAEHLPLAARTAPAGGIPDAIHVDNTAVLAYLVAAVKELGSRLQ